MHPRNESHGSDTDKDKKFMRMIYEMITQDGVLNLQAKNIQQGDPYDTSIIHLNRIFSSKASNRFDSIVRLNLSSNNIVIIDGEFCKNLPNVQQLDLRANRIEEVSHHIKAMLALRVLKLDKNDLVRLPDEIYEIKIL
jgi:Leucine-rich repeat (LRR) protein